MAEPARADIRYTAFLSYSHKDAAAAARLHRRLESYRVPKRLVGSDSPRGPVPQRLWPIFRDREELPAASDLSETVRTALAQSGALIILCSPDAAGSLWVAEEIETFRKLHPDRPILAAILDGDPPDCFPAALRAFGRDGTWHEPLATDLRPKADGKHLGLLKLVAGITGLGLDDLVQRDAARRVRRVMAVTAAAVIAMLIMTALAVVALNARREAERQRAEAEGLVEFMLTDLRMRLKARVGRLDVMQAVNDRALAHYERQNNLTSLSPEAIARRARSCSRWAKTTSRRKAGRRNRASRTASYRTTRCNWPVRPTIASDSTFRRRANIGSVGSPNCAATGPKRSVGTPLCTSGGSTDRARANDPRSIDGGCSQRPQSGPGPAHWRGRQCGKRAALYEKSGIVVRKYRPRRPAEVAVQLAQANALLPGSPDSYFADRFWAAIARPADPAISDRVAAAPGRSRQRGSRLSARVGEKWDGAVTVDVGPG